MNLMPVAQPSGQPELTLRSTANVWGKKSTPAAAAPTPMAPSTNSFANTTNKASPIRIQSILLLPAVTVGVGVHQLTTSGYGGNGASQPALQHQQSLGNSGTDSERENGSGIIRWNICYPASCASAAFSSSYVTRYQHHTWRAVGSKAYRCR